MTAIAGNVISVAFMIQHTVDVGVATVNCFSAARSKFTVADAVMTKV